MEGRESIYDLVLSPAKPSDRHSRYVSKHNPGCPPTSSTFCLKGTSTPGVANVAGEMHAVQHSHHTYKKSSADLGPPPGCSRPDPVVILNKRSKASSTPSLKDVKRTNPQSLFTNRRKQRLKGLTPTAKDRPIMGISSACDRVTANAIDNILSRPRKTFQDALDWTCKPDYGRVPQYLQDVKKTLDLEYAYLESLRNSTKTAGVRYTVIGAVRQMLIPLTVSVMKYKLIAFLLFFYQAGPPGTTQVRVMPDHEKCALLAALKRRWDALNLEYQSTTHIMNLDTIGKARRKENFEEQLAAIEKFIIKASKKTVVVTNV